jgi:hypothetical protein
MIRGQGNLVDDEYYVCDRCLSGDTPEARRQRQRDLAELGREAIGLCKRWEEAGAGVAAIRRVIAERDALLAEIAELEAK